MRGSDRLVAAVAVVVPLLVALVGWPLFVHWLVGPPVQPTPEVAGAAATSVATARAALPTARPTLGLPPTVQPNGAADQATTPAVPAAAPAVPAPVAEAPAPTAPAAATPAADAPKATVSSFYALVAAHQFDAAAQLWSPHLRAAYPPRENINQRFSATQAIQLQRNDVLSQDPQQAMVAVDLIESRTQAGSQHYVGRWYLVHGAGGWLLDQPELQAAP
jgi:cytoskeletal protein RodZ